MNSVTNENVSSLTTAAGKGHTDVVREADVELEDNDGASSPNAASDRGHTAIVKMLLDNTAVNIMTSCVTPLFSAADGGSDGQKLT